MQRAWFNGRRKFIIVFIVIPILTALLTFLLDRFSKIYFENLYKSVGEIVVIPNFFKFTYTINKGAAFSFLANQSWGQLFFKILTPVALILFSLVYVYAIKGKYKFLSIGFSLVVSGTLGNYFDRLIFGGVTDFISFQFGNYYFPVFNVADICLTIGVIMAIIHFLFIDKNAIFTKKKDKKLDNKDNEIENEN